MAKRKPASQQVIDAEFRPEPGYVPPQQVYSPGPGWQGGVRDWRTASGYAPMQRGSFRGFSDGSVTDATQLSAADRIILKAQLYQTIVSLKSAIAFAQARVAATPSYATATWATVLLPTLAPFLLDSAPSDTITAVSNALRVLSDLADMRYSEIDSVMSGALTPARWFAACQAIKDGIDPILQELNDQDTFNSLANAWQDTKDTFEKLKFPLTAGGIGLTTVLLIFAGFIAFQYLTAPLRFLPSKRMAGFSKSKRRTKRKPRRVKAYLL